MRYLQKQKMPLWLVLLLDVALAGILLLCFAFFHHVLPAVVSQNQMNDRPVEPSIPAPSVSASEPADDSDPSDSQETQETPVPTEPDTRTPWQIKFEDHFTDEVVMTDCSYTSPEVSITIETVVTGEGDQKITYYVADIYVASLENFLTYTAHNRRVYFDTQPPEEIAAEAGAILAISGDFLTYQNSGFLLRNGEVYVSDHYANSVCALYPDGTMETYIGRQYRIPEILDRNPLQVWSFGPVLLDEQGKTRETYEVSNLINKANPRSAIGYYEPGHYCFVVVDGRQKGHSRGVTIPELAQIFEDLGCAAAYNLDGGGTAVMLFNGIAFSRQCSGGRDLGDILYITEAGYRKEAEQ